jgi:hypothetical protein
MFTVNHLLAVYSACTTPIWPVLPKCCSALQVSSAVLLQLDKEDVQLDSYVGQQHSIML